MNKNNYAIEKLYKSGESLHQNKKLVNEFYFLEKLIEGMP